MKPTNQSAIGTSFHGTTIMATVEELEQVLGEPTYEENDGSDKVNFEWDMETDKGNGFTVYDWKEYRPISRYERIEWHIGARDESVSVQAQKEVQEALNKISVK